MEPFTFLIGLAITSYVIGGVATDFVAVAKRQEPPSLTKSRERHERKLARGEESNPAPSYLGRIIGNATERWAARSDQKHRDRLDWIEEQKPKRSTKWLDRKRRRAQRYERAAQAFANKSGVLWGKTRDAAEAIRERRAENEAWRRNATAPDPLDPDTSDNPYRIDNEAGPAADGQRTDGQDATVLPFRRPESPDPDTGDGQQEQSKPEAQPESAEHPDAQQGETMTDQTPHNTTPAASTDVAEPSYETISLTATLDRTLASSRQCTALVAEWDQRSVMLTEESKKLNQQVAGIETQIASLQQAGNSGEEIEQLRTAQEQYTAAQQLIDEQQQAAAQVIEAYQAAASAFDQAHAGFQQQTVGQEFYAAHTGAGNKEFLTQG